MYWPSHCAECNMADISRDMADIFFFYFEITAKYEKRAKYFSYCVG